MPSAIITLPNGRRARLEGPTREAILAEAQRLISGVTAPTMSEDEADIAAMQQRLVRRAAGVPLAESRPTRAPITLPFGLGEFSVGGPAASVVRALSNVREEVSVPVALTTGGVALAPVRAGAALASALPRAAGVLRPLARALPQVGGAGAGGAAAGAALEAQRGGTPEEIREAALRSGATMAAWELGGLGALRAGSTLLAPARTFRALRHLDPLRPIRDAVRRFMREAPETTREALRAAEAAHPGIGAASRVAAERLQDITRRVMVGGKVSSRRLREEWQKLSIEQRGQFGSFERFATGVSRIATRTAKLSRTTAGQEILEGMAVPLVTATFGPAAGVLLWGVKQSIAPGPLVRYFSRQTLPGGPITQAVTGGAVRMTPRVIAAQELAEADE